MSDEDLTVGELMDEVEALGWTTYVGCTGQVWRLKYGGEVDMSGWVGKR